MFCLTVPVKNRKNYPGPAISILLFPAIAIDVGHSPRIEDDKMLGIADEDSFEKRCRQQSILS